MGSSRGGGGSGVENDSFWDTQTSGQMKSVIGSGLITAQMQTASTFLEAGWDFAGRDGQRHRRYLVDSRRAGLSQTGLGSQQLIIEY